MPTASRAEDQTRQHAATLFGHPKGLYILFLTEMWERFSFYGVRTLLVFFLTQRFLLSDRHAFAIYGSYGALVYIYPVLGGMLADRYFGYRRAVAYGAVLMIIGHAGLVAQETFFAASGAHAAFGGALPLSRQLFYLSLAVIIGGVGLLKSNISTIVGTLYPRESQQRDSGFTLFNCGINIGATLAAFSCGYLGQAWGWAYGFGLSGAGMVLGLIIFIGGKKYLIVSSDCVADRSKTALGLRERLVPAVVVLLSILLTWQLLPRVEYLGYLVVGALVFALGRTFYIGFTELGLTERQRLWCALIIWAIWCSYAILVEQTGSSINLFNDRMVNLYITVPKIVGGSGAIEIRASQLLGVSGALLLLLSPAFAWLWEYLDRRGRNPSTPVKVCLSLCAMSAGYAIVAAGTLWPDGTGHVRLVWVIGMYLFFALADLLIVPIGLSAMTRLAAGRAVGFMVGFWMMGAALGAFVAGRLAQFSSLSRVATAARPVQEILAHYQRFFGTFALAALVLAMGFGLLTPLMKKWMHGLK